MRRAQHLVRVRARHELVDEPRGHAVGRGPARDAPARVGEPGGHVGEVGLDVDAGVGHPVGEVVGEDAELLDGTKQLGGATGGPAAGDDQVGDRVEGQRGHADPRRGVAEHDVAEGAAAQAVLEHRDRGAGGDGELDAADAGRERVVFGVLVADPLVGQAQPEGRDLAVGAGRGGEGPQDGRARGGLEAGEATERLDDGDLGAREAGGGDALAELAGQCPGARVVGTQAADLQEGPARRRDRERDHGRHVVGAAREGLEGRRQAAAGGTEGRARRGCPCGEVHLQRDPVGS